MSRVVHMIDPVGDGWTRCRTVRLPNAGTRATNDYASVTCVRCRGRRSLAPLFGDDFCRDAGPYVEIAIAAKEYLIEVERFKKAKDALTNWMTNSAGPRNLEWKWDGDERRERDVTRAKEATVMARARLAAALEPLEHLLGPVPSPNRSAG